MIESKKGFTLIELLVVISIIGLLSSVVLAALSTARVKARDSQRIQSLIQLRNALEMYYSTNGHYPELASWGALAAWNNHGYPNWDEWGSEFYNALVSGNYIPSLPQDPARDGTCWPGNYLSSGPSNCRGQAYFSLPTKNQCYVLGTNLENPLDSSHTGSFCGNYQIIGGNCTDGCKSIMPGSPN